jgi:hypothetical protein
MNVERLEHLITLLERKQKEDADRFYMGAWAQPNDSDKPMNLCNTASCALGTAALDPMCNDEGLFLEVLYAENGEHTKFLLSDKAAWERLKEFDIETVDFLPNFKGNTGFAAGAVYYDIFTREADYLFDPGCYPGAQGAITPQHVIERVRNVLNGRVPDYSKMKDEEDDDEQASPTEGFVD